MVYDACTLLFSNNTSDHYKVCSDELNQYMTKLFTDNLPKLFVNKLLLDRFNTIISDYSFRKVIIETFKHKLGSGKYMFLKKIYSNLQTNRGLMNNNIVTSPLNYISLSYYNNLIKKFVWEHDSINDIAMSYCFDNIISRSKMVDKIYSKTINLIYKFPSTILKTCSYMFKFQESLTQEYIKFLINIEYINYINPQSHSQLTLYNKIYRQHYGGLSELFLMSFIKTSINDLNYKLNMCHNYNLFISKLLTNINCINNKNQGGVPCKCYNNTFSSILTIINSGYKLIQEYINYNYIIINSKNSYLEYRQCLPLHYMIQTNDTFKNTFNIFAATIYLRYTIAVICKYKNKELTILLSEIIKKMYDVDNYKNYYQTKNFNDSVFKFDSKTITCKLSIIEIDDYEYIDIVYLSNYLCKYISAKYPEDTDLLRFSDFEFVNNSHYEKWYNSHIISNED